MQRKGARRKYEGAESLA